MPTGGAKEFVMGGEVCTTPVTPYADQPVLEARPHGHHAGDRERRQALDPRAGHDRPGHKLVGGGFYPAGQQLGLVHDRGRGAMKRWAGALLAFARARPARARRRRRRAPLTLTVSAKLDARGVTVRTTGKATRSGRKLTLPLASG